MPEQIRTINEINQKIKEGNAVIVTADEMTRIVKEEGTEKAAKKVDVVTTGTFGMMCSSGAFMNFGHADPPIKIEKAWLNDVPAYAGLAAVDVYIGATELSETQRFNYGGGHVIEDLVAKKEIELRATAYGTDCYPRTELETIITLDDLNQAYMHNPRNAYQTYNAATNSTDKTIYTYMGALLPHHDNVTYSGAGELSPLCNDPNYETIGAGTKIFLCGAQGYVIGEGTQHSPSNWRGTLQVYGNLKEMTTDYLRAATVHKYGVSLFVGVGIPIPILNVGLAEKTGIADDEIVTNVVDYGIPRKDRPALRTVTYGELKSGRITLNGKETRVAPLSSFKKAKEIAISLKKWIEEAEFFLSAPAEKIPIEREFRPMPLRKTPRVKELMTHATTVTEEVSLKKVSQLFIEKQINHIPVITRGGKLKGIITSFDVAKAVAAGLKTLKEVMTKEVVTTSEDELVEEAAKKMVHHNISALPVINSEKLVRGIITSEDISKYVGG